LEIQIFKLLNGENIIGEVITNTPNTITIKHPLRAMLIPQKSAVSLALIRWDHLFEFESVSFNKNTIVAFGNVSSEIEEAYAESIVRYYNGNFMNEESIESDEADDSEELERTFSNIKSKSIH